MGNANQFKAGVRDGIPICLGYFAVSFAFGIQASETGLTPFEAGMLSLLNVTSAGQFAGLSVIAAAGSYIELVLLQFIINLRYMLMSAALSQKLDTRTGTLPRLLIAYGVTDEIFGVSVMRPGKLNPFFSYGCTIISVLGWVGGTVTGASAGAILPERLISALGVALYGMFIAIIIPPARENKKIMYCVGCAMVMSAVFAYAPVLRELSGGMRIIIVTVAVAALFAWLFPVREEEAS